MTGSPKRPHRRWMPHAIGAGSLALLAFLGGAAPEFLSDDFKARFAPYNKWIVGFIVLAALVEAACAFLLARHSASADPPSQPANITTGDRNVSIGQSNSGTIIPGDHNIVASRTQGDVVGRDKITHIHNTPAEPAPKHQLPLPPRDFTGRERELTELLARLGQGVTISGMHGLGGVGKTALALKLAERIKDRCPDAQIYLDLQGVGDNPLTPARAMEHVIRAYHPTARLPESLAELGAIYRSALHGQRALLLLDNVRDREQVEPLVPPASCVLLVTSRQHFTLPGMFYQNLDAMPRADAIKLLLAIAERIDDHADEIARLCGDLPLALRVAASALKVNRNLAPVDYVRRLADAKQRLSHLKEVDVALNVSYEMLSAEQRRLWRVLSVFPQTFDDRAAAAVWEMEHDAAQDALGDLMKWSLVEFNAETWRHRLHDLARLFAEARLSEAGVKETDVAQRRFALHYQMVLVACRLLYVEGDESVLRGLAYFDQEWGNIQAGWGWAEARVEKDLNAAQLCIDYPYTAFYILELRQHPREQIHWFEVALAAARKLEQRNSEGHMLNNLGLASAELGEGLKAIEYYKQALVIDREVSDREEEGRVLNNLGSAYHKLGEMGKAIESHEQALVIDREIGNRREEGKVLNNNLGAVYLNLGEARKAIEFFEQALVIRREIGDRRGEGNALWKLSQVRDPLGDRDQAIALAEASLKIFQEIKDPNVGKVREQLAKWRGQAGTE